MSDILELILTRRNIKRFLPQFVSWEKISHILDAGRHAPSCGNLQNWKFILVYEPEQKQRLAEAFYEQYEVIQAWLLIVICAEPEKAERYYGQKGKELFTIQNCAAAAQNMVLEAHSLGLGSCWVGAFDEEAVKLQLGIPEEVQPQIILAVGYPGEIPQKQPKYPLESLTYFGRWRSKIRDPAQYMNDIATIINRKVRAVQTSTQEIAAGLLEKAKSIKKSERAPVQEAGTREKGASPPESSYE